MAAWDEQASADGRFRIQSRAAAVPPGLEIRLLLARDGRCLLELGDPGCRVDLCCFDAGGRALLHLRFGRRDGSLAAFAATLDLESGLYYHGDPRHAQAPAGEATDLARIAAGGRPSPTDAQRAAGWPAPEELRLPEPVLPAPDDPLPAAAAVAAGAEPAPASGGLSPDGRWEVACEPRLRIVDRWTGLALLDAGGTAWDAEAVMNPCANQVQLRFSRRGAEALHAFVDLDCLLWWETHPDGRFRTGGRLAAPLGELQSRLAGARGDG